MIPCSNPKCRESNTPRDVDLYRLGLEPIFCKCGWATVHFDNRAILLQYAYHLLTERINNIHRLPMLFKEKGVY